MPSYHGDFAPGRVVRIPFNTNDAAGAPITLAGSAVAAAYKDAGTTESTAGVSLSVDFDGRTGSHLVSVDTSADGTFYAAGSDFRVILTAGTVSGTSVVGAVLGSFSIGNRTAQLVLTQVVPPRDVTAATTMDVGDCLAGARALAAGDMSIASTTLTLENPDDSTYCAKTLDSSTAPSSRT